MFRPLLLCALLLIPATSRAESPVYNQVSFETAAARTVPNDLLQATLTAQARDTTPAAVAHKLNRDTAAALKLAARYPGVKLSSGWQSTHPAYGKDNQPEGWQGEARLELESRDFEAAAALIGDLQATLQLQNLRFSVAPDTRRKLEDALTQEALDAFRQRGEVVRGALGASSFRIVNISLGQQGGLPRPRYAEAMPLLAARAQAVPAPEFSAGDSELALHVSGTIELDYGKGK